MLGVRVQGVIRIYVFEGQVFGVREGQEGPTDCGIQQLGKSRLRIRSLLGVREM